MAPNQVESSGQEPNWLIRSGALLITVLLLRAGYAAIVPLELVPDEAYYWDWSRQPAWGYFSKPPMVAWLNFLTTSVGGDSVLAIRSAPVILSTLSLLAVYLLGARMFGGRVGFVSVVLCAASPGATAAALLMTIDAPLIFCWMWAQYFTWRLVGEERSSPWTVAGCVASIGIGLLSKQTMLAFPPLILLHLCSGNAERRRQLRRPAIWISMLVPFLFLIPMILWNVRHNWVTVMHTASHFSTEQTDVLRRIVISLEFLASQFVLVSPVTFVLAVCAVVTCLRRFHRLPQAESYLFTLGGLPLLGTVIISLTQRVQPNWPAVAWPAVIVLATAMLSRKSASTVKLDFIKPWLRRAAICGIGCVVIVYLSPYALQSTGLAGTKLDFAQRLRGWKTLADSVAEHVTTDHGEQEPLVICITSRGVVSELAFYLPRQPRVYRWWGGRVECQHGIWGGPSDCAGRDAILVVESPLTPESLPSSTFLSLEFEETLEIPIGQGQNRQFEIYRGRGMTDWPTFAEPDHAASDETSPVAAM